MRNKISMIFLVAAFLSAFPAPHAEAQDFVLPPPPPPPPNAPPPPPPNASPTATNVSIQGTPQVGQVLTGNYTYADAENDPEGASTFRWLRVPLEPIAGATARTYALVAADEGAQIRFQVTPVPQRGSSPGTTVRSAAVGPSRHRRPCRRRSRHHRHHRQWPTSRSA
jgi:hypothetical protein